jgi:hypothetical protein
MYRESLISKPIYFGNVLQKASFLSALTMRASTIKLIAR